MGTKKFLCKVIWPWVIAILLVKVFPKSERWPDQLVASLADENIFLNSPEIIAKTGWTTD